MSNTRRTNLPGAIKQERFASSQEYDRGLMANLVAKRCSVLDRAEDRELIWSVQLLSHEPGALKKLAADLMARFPDRLATDSMRKFGMQHRQIYSADQVRIIRNEMGAGCFPLKGDRDFSAGDMSDLLEDTAERRQVWQEKNKLFPSNYPAADFVKGCREAGDNNLEKHLLTLCLDPALPVADGSPWYFPTLVSTLREFMVERIESHRRQASVTSLGKIVHEALDYTLEAGVMSLIEGETRFGKSHAVKDWCARLPGRVRYVELESNRDEISFFRAIAEALGVSINLNSKAQALRLRIEETLQAGDLMLIVDESHFLWPALIDSRTLPSRINWILTALVNKGVAVALVTTNQFFRNQTEFEKRTRWSSGQLTGRIGHYEKLPAALPLDDLRKVAAAIAPEADARTIQTLADYANVSEKYLAGIRHVVDRARFIARKDGREKIQFGDVKQAMKQHVIPSDKAFSNAIGQTNHPSRKRAANVFATTFQSDLKPDETRFQSQRSIRPAAADRFEKEEFTHA